MYGNNVSSCRVVPSTTAAAATAAAAVAPVVCKKIKIKYRDNARCYIITTYASSALC